MAINLLNTQIKLKNNLKINLCKTQNVQLTIRISWSIRAIMGKNVLNSTK